LSSIIKISPLKDQMENASTTYERIQANSILYFMIGMSEQE
jgi:hypothetical protein